MGKPHERRLLQAMDRRRLPGGREIREPRDDPRRVADPDLAGLNARMRCSANQWRSEAPEAPSTTSGNVWGGITTSQAKPHKSPIYGQRTLVVASCRMANRLGTIAPREQVGAKTGAAYEFQYGEAALACLELLANGDDACVYCEWHDDYVIETTGVQPNYKFFQVKSRSSKQGPWPMGEILGVVGKRLHTSAQGSPRKSKRTSKKTPKPLVPTKQVGIAERLLDHQRRFSTACAVFALVTTHDVANDAFFALLDEAKQLHQARADANAVHLTTEGSVLFRELVAAYQIREPSITETEVWSLIARLNVIRARGRPGEPAVIIGLMGQRIYDLSEVDLATTEQRRVAAQLIDLVRTKSHRTLDANPLPSEGHVRTEKAIGFDDVLSLLALSPEGFRELQSGGQADVRTLSRLHRLCRDSGMDPKTINLVCKLRVQWEKWRSEHQDSLTDDLLLVLSDRGRTLLRQVQAGITMAELREVAQLTAGELAAIGGLPALEATTVLGLVFAIASEGPHG